MSGLPKVIFEQDLLQRVLLEPAVERGHRQLSIISGFSSPGIYNMVLEKLQAQGITDAHILVIIGMLGGKISAKDHHAYLRTMERWNDRFEARYVSLGIPDHRKYYFWTGGAQPEAYYGSANCGYQAFEGQQHDGLVPVCPLQAHEEMQQAYENSVAFTDESIKLSGGQELTGEEMAEVNAAKAKVRQYQSVRMQYLIPRVAPPHVNTDEKWIEHFTLLDRRTGEPPNQSGINWGHRPGTSRNRNTACINIPASIIASGFFTTPAKQPFPLLMHDGKNPDVTLMVSRTQGNGKGLSSKKNADIGLWLRTAMGLGSGVYVTRNDLFRHRTYVTITRYKRNGNYEYELDFSPLRPWEQPALATPAHNPQPPKTAKRAGKNKASDPNLTMFGDET